MRYEIKSGSYADIIMAEVIGQIEYLNKFGTFPADQLKFCLDYLKGNYNAKKTG